MMLPVDMHMAMDSIRSAKWRSFLTMLGVIVGVASVVTIVSIGQGVKQQVVGQITDLGTELITVRPGKLVTRTANGAIKSVNFAQAITNGVSLSDKDLQAVKQTPGLETAVPLSVVSGIASLEGSDLTDDIIYGTTDDLPSILRQKVEFGGFFSATDTNRNIAVIGQNVAVEHFKENAPVGRSFTIHGQSFVVGGVFERFTSSPLSPGTDYNDAIFIPYDAATLINNNQAQIQQILGRASNQASVAQVAAAVTDRLKRAHGGQVDFTILNQQDNLAIASSVVNLLTTLISGIAAISLLVGGIGIMNIMLVSVSERTHEIGVRKAVGATGRQIMGQFLTEAVMISLVGGLIGVVVSLVANYFIRLFTSLTPAVDVQIIGVAVLVALAVGAFFGIAPAIKAARKDPIDALRQV